MIHNIRMTISYDGAEFHGFQKQDGVRTAQGELESALARLTGETVATAGASRTDAGVHALGQTVSFHTESTIPPDRFHLALTPFMPPDLAAITSQEAPMEFHARHAAVAKEYHYVTYQYPRPIPFLRGHALHIDGTLDVPAMRAAAAHLVGTHDFTAFGNTGSGPANPVKTIYKIDFEERPPLLVFRLHGTSFLYKMVRNIAGTLIEVGRGRAEPRRAAEALESRSRQMAGPTMPPHALYLIRVDYPPEVFHREAGAD